MSTIKYRWTDRPMLPGYLLQAVQRGEVKKVRNWLLRGESVDAQCTGLTGYSLLHAAAVYERCQLVTELIDRGATVDLRSDEGSTALMAASEQNIRGSKTVRLLLEHAANPNLAQQDGITALMSAARTRRDAAIVTTLLEHSAHPDQRSKHGCTALMIAAAEGHTNCVQALLAAHADPGLAMHIGGRTALSFAEERGHASISQLLRGNTGPTTTPRTRKHSPDSTLLYDLSEVATRNPPSVDAEASVVQLRQASEWARADAAMAKLLAEEATQAQQHAKPRKRKGKKRATGVGSDHAASAALAAIPAEPAAAEPAATGPAATGPAAAEPVAIGLASIQPTEPAAEDAANADAANNDANAAGPASDVPEPAAARATAAPVKVPDAFVCPLTFEIMHDPALLVGDGQTYERAEIERWLQTKQTSPMTNEKLDTTLLAPNVVLRGMIIEFRETHLGVDFS